MLLHLYKILTNLSNSDGPAKRGRGGRGGGPGSRGGRGGRGGGEGGRGRGGGPGSRGGTTTTRKPRITKLEKQRMEAEKTERESMAKAVSGGTASSTNTTTAANAGAYGLVMPSGVPSLSASLGAPGVLAGQ